MRKRWIILICAIVLCLVWLVYWIVFPYNPMDKSLKESESKTIAFKSNVNDYIMLTAAHIDGNNFKGYKRIYTDENLDLAVYINQEYTPNLPDVDTQVTSSDFIIKGTVVSTNSDGFYFEPEDTTLIRKGISGTKIYDTEGRYLGFISYKDSDNNVYCLAY